MMSFFHAVSTLHWKQRMLLTWMRREKGRITKNIWRVQELKLYPPTKYHPAALASLQGTGKYEDRYYCSLTCLTVSITHGICLLILHKKCNIYDYA